MDSDDDSSAPLVVDTGSDTTKAGLAGKEAPQLCTPSQLGAQPHERMEQLWREVLGEFRPEAEQHPGPHVLLAEPALSPREERERACQLWFEDLGAGGFYLNSAQVLQMYSAGRTTGIILDCGHDAAWAVAIYEGYTLPHLIIRGATAGSRLTEHLGELLPDAAPAMLKEVKQQLCYVAADPCAERQMFESRRRMALAFVMSQHVPAGSTVSRLPGHLADKIAQRVLQAGGWRLFEMPDGELLVGSAQFECAELMFSEASFTEKSIQRLALDTLNGTDLDVRLDFSRNFVLAGGSSMFRGMEQRLLAEMKAASANIWPADNLKLVAPADRQWSAWQGGSILTSLATFDAMWVSRQDYNDDGPGVVHRKCFN